MMTPFRPRTVEPVREDRYITCVPLVHRDHHLHRPPHQGRMPNVGRYRDGLVLRPQAARS